MTLRNNIFFPYFLGFFPYNSKNKGERQKRISDSTSKNTSIKKNFYMTLKDNNTLFCFTFSYFFCYLNESLALLG